MAASESGSNFMASIFVLFLWWGGTLQKEMAILEVKDIRAHGHMLTVNPLVPLTGLQIFRAVVEPWNSGESAKSHEIHKNMQNTAKFSRNLIKYMSQLLGVFMCRKLTNLCQNVVTETCKQCSEATRRRLCCEKLGTSHDVKGFATGSSLECIVVERANDDLC